MPKLIPASQKRRPLMAKVDPKTIQFLDSLGEQNYGRAVDRAAELAGHAVEFGRRVSRSLPPESVGR